MRANSVSEWESVASGPCPAAIWVVSRVLRSPLGLLPPILSMAMVILRGVAHSFHFFSNRSIALGRQLMNRIVMGSVRVDGGASPPLPVAPQAASAAPERPAA